MSEHKAGDSTKWNRASDDDNHCNSAEGSIIMSI